MSFINRVKPPDQLRKTVVATREKERVYLGKRMIRCTESTAAKMIRKGRRGYPTKQKGQENDHLLKKENNVNA